MNNDVIYLSGTILDEEHCCDLEHFCRLCGISAEQVRDMVEEGLIRPLQEEPGGWCFSGIAIRRVQTAVRLQRDLQVNLAGCALVLDLLDELHELRCQLRGR